MVKDVSELTALLAPHTLPNQATILSRMLACNSTHLKPTNRTLVEVRKKVFCKISSLFSKPNPSLQGFFDVLLDYCSKLAEDGDIAALNNIGRCDFDVRIRNSSLLSFTSCANIADHCMTWHIRSLTMQGVLCGPVLRRFTTYSNPRAAKLLSQDSTSCTSSMYVTHESSQTYMIASLH